MENSFFEYRDKSDAESDVESDFVDDSVIEDITCSAKKKNHTVFVAESEESGSCEESEEEGDKTGGSKSNLSRSSQRRSSVMESRIISSSEDDGSRRGSIKRPSKSQNNVVVTTSDEEEDYSPELIPKRRPPQRPPSLDSSDSMIFRKTKKRIMALDSDTDNSIILEHNKNKKQTCLQKTPFKMSTSNQQTNDTNKSMDLDNSQVNDTLDESKANDMLDESKTNDTLDDSKTKDENQSVDYDNVDQTTDLDQTSFDKTDVDRTCADDSKDLSDEDESSKLDIPKKKGNTDQGKEIDNHTDQSREIVSNSDQAESDIDSLPEVDLTTQLDKSLRQNSKENSPKSDVEEIVSEDDGPDEDLMAVSRATRMSIMGIIPKDNDSDDSDYIQSDDSSRQSKESIPEKNVEEDLDDLPEVTIQGTPTKNQSRISCSPFTSPLHDLTNLDDSTNNPKPAGNKDQIAEVVDLCDMPAVVLNSSFKKGKENCDDDDDDVTIIDTKPEVIALSSDDEDEIKIETKKSPRPKKSPAKSEDSSKRPKDNTIKSYLVPPSYPNQVVYVKRHVRENELDKLMRLKEDLSNVRNLLEKLDLVSLPDGGVNLIERLSALEEETRRQGDKVANMVVEPDEPTMAEMTKDGLNKGLSWDDIQKNSNAVQPRMFGKQAMATHMAERSLILETLRALHESLSSRPAEDSLAPAPPAVTSTLMRHQLHALAWLQWRETQRPRAGILADDMGLGKTITMIALIASDKKHIDDDDDDDDEPRAKKMVAGGTLVVCPASLLQQWAGEVKKHCAPHALSVSLHHGAARAAQPLRLAAHDMVATTYNILQREMENAGPLSRVRWRRVVLDEAHIVRNHKSLTSRAVSRLTAARRWALSGTPVHNKDIDLYALLKFLKCEPFDDLTMWKKWIDNKSIGGQERLNTVLSSLLLRRTKAQLQLKGELKCLPTKTPHMNLVTLTPQEMNVYQKVLVLSKSLFAQFLQQRAEKNSDYVGFDTKQKNTEYHKMHKKMVALQGVKPVKSHEILVLLLRLRQVCCHCGLIASMLDATATHEEDASDDLLNELDKLSLNDSKRKSVHKEDEEDYPEEESATAAEAIRAVLAPNNPVFKLDKPSSKIEAVMECLTENVLNKKGEKAVVVSQWTSVLRLVEAQLKSRRIRSVTLSGAVPVPHRPKLIQDLNDPNNDIKVMLLSLCAGGVGINLCGANHLLLLDPHWNPQLEEQAQDRVYRVGQAKDVHIYRFVTVDTVEQTIRKLQEAKLQLAENVLTGARNNAASALSIEDLKMLFNMGQ